MAKHSGKLPISDLVMNLQYESNIAALDILDKFDKAPEPAENDLAALKNLFAREKNLVMAFQLKKSFRYGYFKRKGAKILVNSDNLKKLLGNPARIDDLALLLLSMNPAEAFMNIDLIRASSWENFASRILPNFCKFFNQYGSVEDEKSFLALTRHPEPVVMAVALSALPKFDPVGSQAVIEPLLNSPLPLVRAEAIQAMYPVNKSLALNHFSELIRSPEKSNMLVALNKVNFFPYVEMEPYLLRLMVSTGDKEILRKIGRIFCKNAYPELPLKILKNNKNLDSAHKLHVNGILVAVAKTLSLSGAIEEDYQDYITGLLREQQITTKNTVENLVYSEEKSASAKASDTFEDKGESELKKTEESEEIEEASQEESTPSIRTKSRRKRKKISLDVDSIDFPAYKQLSLDERLFFLMKAPESFFLENRTALKERFQSSTAKEQGNIIKLFGKYGDKSDAASLKKFLHTTDDEDLVSAAIKAFAELDVDYLLLYLPTFMQSENTKIRMTAMQVFSSIDRDSIASLVTGLLSSQNREHKILAVNSIVTLDFEIVRKPLIEAFSNELSGSLADKLGLTLLANVDRDLLLDMCRLGYSESPNAFRGRNLAKSMSVKLSELLGGISSPEELLEEAKKISKEEKEERLASMTLEEKAEFDPQAKAQLAEQIRQENTLWGIFKRCDLPLKLVIISLIFLLISGAILITLAMLRLLGY